MDASSLPLTLPLILPPILPQDRELERQREMLQLRLEAYELLEKAEIQFLLELSKRMKKRKSERKTETNRLGLESQQLLDSLQQWLEADRLIPLKLILKLLLEDEEEEVEE
jgi:hypothetical protein